MNKLFLFAALSLLMVPFSFAAGDYTPPAISASVAPYGQGGGNGYAITARAYDDSGISEIKIYVAQGDPSAPGAYSFTKTCSSSPCVFTTSSTPGPYAYYATATDSSPSGNIAASDVETFTLPLYAAEPSPFAITTASLPNGAVGQQYSATISTNSTAISSSWSVSAGALPPGLMIAGSRGSASIFGTPYAAGAYSFKVQAVESATGSLAGQMYTITISPAPSSLPYNLDSGGADGTVAGTYSTTTKVVVTCAGDEGQVNVGYLTPGSPSALVEIFYVEGNTYSNVFSDNTSTTSSLPFVPEKAGTYELHMSIEGVQTASDFTVPSCGLDVKPSPRTITVSLSPQLELELSRRVAYAGGFAKVFNVYRVSSQANGTRASYSTEITLTYTNTGGAMENLTIADSVPRAVLSSPDGITFQDQPSAVVSVPEPTFTWNIRSIAAGATASYSYRIERQLTDQMIDSFAPPRVLAAGEAINAPASPSGTLPGGDLLAAFFGYGISVPGFSMPISTFVMAACGIVLLALAALFVFGRRKEEE